MGQLLSAKIFRIVRERAGGSFEVEEDTTATRDDNDSGSERASSHREIPQCDPARKNEEAVANRPFKELPLKIAEDCNISDSIFPGSPQALSFQERDDKGWSTIASSNSSKDGCTCFRRKSGQVMKGGHFACYVNHGGCESFCHHANTGSDSPNDLSVHSMYPPAPCGPAARSTCSGFIENKNLEINTRDQSVGVDNTMDINNKSVSQSLTNREFPESSPAYSVHWCEVSSVKGKGSNTFTVDINGTQENTDDVTDSACCDCPRLWTLIPLPSCFEKDWIGDCVPNCQPCQADGGGGGAGCHGNVSPRKSRCGKWCRALGHSICCNSRDDCFSHCTQEESRMRPDSVVIVDILGGMSASTADKNKFGFSVDGSSGSDGGRAGSTHMVHHVQTDGASSRPFAIVEQPRSAAAPSGQNELLRTGSVQSDSSGFGDADPTPDSGHSEGDQPKIHSLGSSHDSGDTTLAGSSGSHQHRLHLQQTHYQPGRGEMATQTPAISPSMSTSNVVEAMVDAKGDKQSPLPEKERSSFITTCFIPSLPVREGQTTDGLRHRRGSQHPSETTRAYQQQQQQQFYGPHQQQHYSDPLGRRLSNISHKSEALFHVPLDPPPPPPTTHPTHPGFYSPYDPPAAMHPPWNSPYRRNFYKYPDYEDSDPEFYLRGYHRSRSYRSAMSDSEWSGYPDRDYFSNSYYHDYNYNYTPPQHRRLLHRHRSLDYPTDYMDYPRDGYVNGERENFPDRAPPPRRYRSQLELFTTGTGRVAAGPTNSMQRSQSEDAVLNTDGAEEKMESGGAGRNQMPLSEELAAAIGGNRTPSHKTELELQVSPSKGASASSSVQTTPAKSFASPSSSSFTSTKTVLPAARPEGENPDDCEGSNDGHSLVSSIFIPASPSLTLTPATPEVSKFKSNMSLSVASDGSHMFSATPVTLHEGSHISGQNLPALAGNLRSLPQGRNSTPLDHQPNQCTSITVTTSSSSSSGPLASASVTSTGLVSRTGAGTPKIFSSSSSASASSFRSQKPKSCDILDDDDDIEFSNGLQRTSSSKARSGSELPSSSASSYVSHVYYESKSGGGGGMVIKEGPVLNIAVTSPFTTTNRPPSQHSGSLPSSPSLRQRWLGPLPSPSRRYPPYHGYPPSPHHQRSYSSSSSSLPPMPYPGPHHPLSFSRGSDDMDGYFSSSVAESSSDLSFRSTPEWGGRAGILNSRKLARLINQPIYFKGHRRPGSNYRPRRLFREWAMLSKRKRLQEENRLLQHTLHKYKTELGLMESSLKIDFQAAVPDMTKEERDQVAHVEWLWSEVKNEVAEMERLLLSRIKSVQSGNDFHSLLANIGVINKITELLKEQIYQQQVISSRGTEADDEEDDSFNNNGEEGEDTPDDLEMLDEEDDFDVERHSSGGHSDPFWEGRNRSFHGLPHHPRPSLSWMAGVGPASTPRHRSQGNTTIPGSRGQAPRGSASTSNLPEDLNLSLEQMKSSLLTQMHQEIKDSTRKLELDLQAKDKEIQELKTQIGSRSARSTPDLTHRTVFKINTKDWSSRPGTPQGQGHEPLRKRSRSRSRMMGDRIVQETDV